MSELRAPDLVIHDADFGIGQTLEWWRKRVDVTVAKKVPFGGVYVYCSPSGDFLYVGKGKDVAERLRHHFNKDQYLTLFTEGEGNEPGEGLHTRRWTYQNEFPSKRTRIAIWSTDGRGLDDEARRLEARLIQAHILAFGCGPRHNRTIPGLVNDRLDREPSEALKDAEFLAKTLLPALVDAARASYEDLR